MPAGPSGRASEAAGGGAAGGGFATWPLWPRRVPFGDLPAPPIGPVDARPVGIFGEHGTGYVFGPFDAILVLHGIAPPPCAPLRAGVSGGHIGRPIGILVEPTADLLVAPFGLGVARVLIGPPSCSPPRWGHGGGHIVAGGGIFCFVTGDAIGLSDRDDAAVLRLASRCTSAGSPRLRPGPSSGPSARPTRRRSIPSASTWTSGSRRLPPPCRRRAACLLAACLPACAVPTGC